jgi:hypothetical protein
MIPHAGEVDFKRSFAYNIFPLHPIRPDEIILFIILRVVLFTLNLTSRPKRRMHFNNVCDLDDGENILTQERESDRRMEQNIC